MGWDGLVVGYEISQAGKLQAMILKPAVRSACRALVGDPHIRGSCSDDRGVGNIEISAPRWVGLVISWPSTPWRLSLDAGDSRWLLCSHHPEIMLDGVTSDRNGC